jgi:Ca2+-binding EF-hand superfamily protein
MMAGTEKEHVLEFFKAADKDGNGFVGREELEHVFRKLGDWSDNQFKVLFQAADINMDGQLNYEEFVDWCMFNDVGDDGVPTGVAVAAGDDTTKGILEFFKDADTDGNLLIGRDELERVFRKLGDWSDDQFNVLLQAADTNMDGQLNYCEFVDWCLFNDVGDDGVPTGTAVVAADDTTKGVLDLFKEADKDGNGLINRDELEAIFRKLGPWSHDQFSVLFQAADLNNDDHLHYTEFVDWCLFNDTGDDGVPTGLAVVAKDGDTAAARNAPKVFCH